MYKNKNTNFLNLYKKYQFLFTLNYKSNFFLYAQVYLITAYCK